MSEPAGMPKLLLLNGPNINLLGAREPGMYGSQTLDQIHARMHALAAELGVQLDTFQSNSEGALIDCIQAAQAAGTVYIIFNPAAYTHTSVALRDALTAGHIPFIEVHLTNVYAREPFRRHSYFSDIARGTITGMGALGYELALRAAAEHLANSP